MRARFADGEGRKGKASGSRQGSGGHACQGLGKQAGRQVKECKQTGSQARIARQAGQVRQAVRARQGGSKGKPDRAR
jgi:hypothetical protein